MSISRRILLWSGVATAVNAGVIVWLKGLGSSGSVASSGSPQEAATEVAVTIQGFQFLPPEVVVKQGGRVTFTNQDSTPHTATPTNGATFTGTGRLKKGESKVVEFTTAGVQEYFCDIHPSMVGKVTVLS
ncbi:MAG: cupredoxin domain-containing protein [Cyanobacteriota bacterium]|nr:cupredoxin domain-containing protein [Cyanobacteriota bacterium]